LSVTELPVDLTTLSVFRSLTCHANIIVITMPSTSAMFGWGGTGWPRQWGVHKLPSVRRVRFK
jgi:hypothetical protein